MNILVDEYADNLVKLDATHSNMQMSLVEIRMDNSGQSAKLKFNWREDLDRLLKINSSSSKRHLGISFAR